MSMLSHIFMKKKTTYAYILRSQVEESVLDKCKEYKYFACSLSENIRPPTFVTSDAYCCLESERANDEDDTCANIPVLGATPVRRRLTLDVRLNIHQLRIHSGSLVETGSEPTAFRPHRRDLTTRPLWPSGLVVNEIIT
ncbi:hypothetical protein AVEN_112594-1 [Araneus ventricosus]|uniref:Uncharacterized protein n=1 Tax=Araneus ventricosus TaxID=182803 RepID=A0A4Y2L2T8_ARAVE|nr:hypothetical protein AVEN_112594-1 [Araneus ventricosus]